jgi:CheY-like chemotaxis protein
MARILVIEDDIQVQEMLHQMLTHEGHEVQVASNGIEGIRCYQKTPADLVITDIIMPEKSGLETIMESVYNIKVSIFSRGKAEYILF